LTTIINYNLGNPKSIKNMLSFLGIDAVISDDLNTLKSANRLILPGVGHFEHGMNQLNDLGITDVIKEHALTQQKPFLGICLGMQLMTNFSEEGDVDGLGLIDAQTKKFQLQDKSFKIPHMGWNEVSWQKESPILHSLSEKPRYYFVHSYFVECNNQNDVLGTTHYGQDFVSAFQHDNIIGMQFHPEKSHQFGMELLQNFTKL
jgi:imidazole glycerol-phosphate synthase subunit HisH